MAKQKGKRNKGKQDTAPQPRSAPPSGTPSATTTRDAGVAQSAATAVVRAEETGLRVEGNVIHLPAPAADATATATNDGSGAHPTPRGGSTVDADVSALREPEGERERTTVPPAEAAASEAPKAEEPAKAEAAGEPAKSVELGKRDDPKARSFFDPRQSEAPKAEESAKAEKPEEAMAAAQAAEALKADDKKADAKKADDKKADAKKADDKKTDAKKADDKKADAGARKDPLSRDRKESLSSHLSDEARAFFSEQAYQAAYKTTHDTFEDLVPATEDHARETARSRQWMKISGAVVAGIIAVSVGFAAWHSQYAVRETTLLASRPTQPLTTPESQLPQPDPTPAPEPQPTPAPVAPEPAPAPGATAPEPAPGATAPAPGTSTPAPGATTPETAPGATAPAPGATAPAPGATAPAPGATAPAPGTSTPAPGATAPLVPAAVPAPAAAPTGQTPQQLLAAARGFRGAMPGRVAAYEAYFDAAPTDGRTMTTFAFSLAEMGRHADAERIANRAVTASPNSAQAWFVLAASRKALRNPAGAAEARTRCIALGGDWAIECRALQ